MPRVTSLIDEDPDMIEAALRHPLQVETCEIIGDLIVALRTLEKPAAYFEFQGLLFEHLRRAEERRSEAARNAKRAERGQPVPTPGSRDWKTELLVANRAVRQLRSVGDAFAWRSFSYDRRFLLALSRNAPPGPMFGKKGLERELGEVVHVWRQERCFGLLHDLTSSLRIADLTKFTPEGPRLVEVKQRPGHIPASQMERIQRAIEVINNGAPLPGEDGDVALFVSRHQFKTHLKRLRDILAAADREGFSSLPIGHGWAVNAVSFLSRRFPADFEAGMKESTKRRERAFVRAGLDRVAHRFRGVSPAASQARENPAGAPFAIYPFDPDVCARLTCDLLVFETVIAWDRLATAFEAEGFETKSPLPDRNEDMTGDQDVLYARRGNRGLTIQSSGLSQVLFECVDPGRYAAAAREVLERLGGSGSAIFTFANERAVWR
jgi:hypothetical protein